MPLLMPLLVSAGSILAWENLFGGQDTNQSALSWSNVLKIAAVAGAAYLAARAVKGLR